MLLVVSSPQPPPAVIEPGYWNFSATVLFGLKSEGRQCLTADQIGAFLIAPHNKHYHCTLPSSRFEAGKMEAQGECLDRRGHRYAVNLHGDYTRWSFRLKGTIHGLFFEIPLTSPIVLSATRLAETCPQKLDR